jgi:hypothetical protein
VDQLWVGEGDLMTTSTDSIAAARWDLPVELIERGKDNTLRLRLYRSGAPVTPSAVTISVYPPSGDALVSGAAAVIADGQATYLLAGSVTTGLGLGEAYRVVWVADGQTYDIPAALIRRVLYPTITDLDVRRRWGYLDSGTRGTITSQPTWQAKIDDAWITLLHRLLAGGRYPWRVLDPSAMREAHLLLTGAMIHDELSARGNPVMQDRASQLRSMFEAEWLRLPLVYDHDDDGRQDGRSKLGADAPLWLGGAPTNRHRWRRP